MQRIGQRPRIGRHIFTERWLCYVAWQCVALACLVSPALAQSPPSVPPSSTDPAGTQSTANTGMIRLNFPQDVELKVLVDYVSQRLGMKILYDEEIANKKISLRAPGEVPAESLMNILQSAVKMKGLALVEAEVPGWKRIVAGAKLPSMAPTGEAQAAAGGAEAASALTQIFVLHYADSQKVDQVIKPFLSQSGANSISIKEPNVLIVTDYSSNLLKIAKLVELMDQARSAIVVEFMPIRNVEAPTLAQQITALMTAKAKAQGENTSGGSGIEIAADARTNQLVLLGSRALIDEAVKLIRTFDVPLGLTTEVYSCRYISPERLDRLAKQLVPAADAKRLYQAVVDNEGSLLVVTATAEIHAQIRALHDRLDAPTTAQQSPIRFYQLKNTTVDKVLDTLRAMDISDGANGGAPSVRGASGVRATPVSASGSIPLPLGSGQAPPTNWPSGENSPPGQPSGSAGLLSAGGEKSSGVFFGGARISADANTNSLIIVADPPVQRMYEELIRSLDRRPPQVLIEAKVVALDCTNSFSFGVDLGGKLVGNPQLLTFSSFGLSTPNAVTGALNIIPGTGFNGALIDPNGTNIVLRSLASSSRARILASPRVLVNDNSKGQLQSILSMPFASVNASQTVATTSVGGSQDAGTTIDVTPHISEGDHLQLEFSIEFSSFAQGSQENLPPPRHIDKVQSIVTIPDGHTVIVGGLNRQGRTHSESGLPVLGSIPVAKYLFSNHTDNRDNVSLFVFLRPMILRDDKFKDLKFLSETDTSKAQLQGQYPSSEPILMR